ncbi:MAG: hypothetical protein PHD81_04830 [Candidatus Nanoarchaeia archaeon]|nr:hypothetical protein [Candidatus Nanoarchaeia archaeon]MDD5588402.1 hypothetical protein [Candidatus Nanoarchaeia archaeon]
MVYKTLRNFITGLIIATGLISCSKPTVQSIEDVCKYEPSLRATKILKSDYVCKLGPYETDFMGAEHLFVMQAVKDGDAMFHNYGKGNCGVSKTKKFDLNNIAKYKDELTDKLRDLDTDHDFIVTSQQVIDEISRICDNYPLEKEK